MLSARRQFFRIAVIDRWLVVDLFVDLVSGSTSSRHVACPARFVWAACAKRVSNDAKGARRMELRVLVRVFGVLLALTALLSSGSLIVITNYLHSLTSRVEGNLESVRAAEEIELHLFWHARHWHLVQLTGESRYAAEAAEAHAQVLRWQASARRHIGSADEQMILGNLERSIDAYFREQMHLASIGMSPTDAYLSASAPLEAAYRDAEELLSINLDQAAEAGKRARRWDATANGIGVSAAILSLTLVGITIVGAHAYVYSPLREINRVLRKFAGQDYTARVGVAGAQEIRDIGHSFNEMAAALESHRATRLSFLAAVAHDLRNPLSAIKTALASEMQHGSKSSPGGGTAATIMSRQVDLLVRLTSDLLETTRIEAGQFSIDCTECDARELASRAVELFRASAPARDLVIRVPDQRVPVLCDQVRMEQVMNNLLSNAIKYSPNGGRVEVCVSRESGDVVFQVRDAGIGIPADEQELVFEPFRRGRGSRETIPGVGLGLAVARRIVEAHGGSLTVESAPGCGSTFVIRLPSDK
jgi:signal transduction histidine kinase